VPTGPWFAALRSGNFSVSTGGSCHGIVNPVMDVQPWLPRSVSESNYGYYEDPSTNQYKFVDPDGLFIERAHDLSISMREWSAELRAVDPVALARKRCALLSGLTGVPEDAIWQWAFIERLVNGLRYIEVGLEEHAAEFPAVVEAWAEV
jgi:hypothetical protein